MVDPIKHTLCYYSAPPGLSTKPPKPLGVINLVNSDVETIKDPKFENVFTLKTAGRDYVISAPDKFKMNTWMSVLKINSRLGTMAQELRSDAPVVKQKKAAKAQQRVGKVFTESFKMAADKMLQSLNENALSSRVSLEDTSNNKYKIKCQLKKYHEVVKKQREESEATLRRLREGERECHRSLDSINVEITTLDKFLQASRYLQREAISVLAVNHYSSDSVRILRQIPDQQSLDIPFDLQVAFKDAVNRVLKPAEKEARAELKRALAEPIGKGSSRSGGSRRRGRGNLDISKVLMFYSQYYDHVHLPKELLIQPAKNKRLSVWRQLVKAVNGIKTTCTQLSELTLIEKKIDSAINPGLAAVEARARPISMCDPDEDPEAGSDRKTAALPTVSEGQQMKGKMAGKAKGDEDLGLSLYNKEWEDIYKVIQILDKLRNREREMSQKLDDALHYRELLASFSDKGKPAPASKPAKPTGAEQQTQESGADDSGDSKTAQPAASAGQDGAGQDGAGQDAAEVPAPRGRAASVDSDEGNTVEVVNTILID